MKEKSIADTKFYKILQYVHAFLMANLYFLLTNITFILVLLYFPISFSFILFFSAALIPAAPSLTALFSAMGKLNKNKEINPGRDFFKSYKSNFGKSLIYGLINITLFTILTVDFLFLISREYILLAVITGIILLLLILMTINGFAVLSTFEVSLKNLFIFSFLMVIKNVTVMLKNISFLFAFGIISYAIPSIAILFVFSILVFYLMRNTRPILEEMKIKYSTDSKEENNENKL